MSNRHPWRWVGLSLTGIAVVAGGATYYAYHQDMQAAHERIATGSRVVETAAGPVELAEWGSGPAVLAVHGAGGGYDQGRVLAETLGGDRFHWIAPSRFGYLRSPLAADASTPAQADAFAALLDALGIERVAILAMSGGVPPSLQFALRYPQRTSALVLLSSAPYTPFAAEEQSLPIPAWLYQALFSSDFPFWAIEKIAPSRLAGIFDARVDNRARAREEAEPLLEGILRTFQPVTKRLDGLANEAAAIDPETSYPLTEIAAPALVVHARDDGINPFRIGEYTAERISRAIFVPLESGGHLLIGHQAEVRARVSGFLLEHAGAENR
jgi:2-hydroxy-6-oxonona-2,4-dienedioate hydrolase